MGPLGPSTSGALGGLGPLADLGPSAGSGTFGGLGALGGSFDSGALGDLGGSFDSGGLGDLGGLAGLGGDLESLRALLLSKRPSYVAASAPARSAAKNKTVGKTF